MQMIFIIVTSKPAICIAAGVICSKGNILGIFPQGMERRYVGEPASPLWPEKALCPHLLISFPITSWPTFVLLGVCGAGSQPPSSFRAGTQALFLERKWWKWYNQMEVNLLSLLLENSNCKQSSNDKFPAKWKIRASFTSHPIRNPSRDAGLGKLCTHLYPSELVTS